jgi:quercetin dioxygenase-like cupin family protein
MGARLMPEWRALASVAGGSLVNRGGEARILEQGTHGVLLEVRFRAGVATEEHRHEHDSYLYLVSGHIVSTVDGERVELRPGASLQHPARVMHSVTAVLDSRWLEFKSPAPSISEDAGGSLRINS